MRTNLQALNDDLANGLITGQNGLTGSVRWNGSVWTPDGVDDLPAMPLADALQVCRDLDTTPGKVSYVWYDVPDVPA